MKARVRMHWGKLILNKGPALAPGSILPEPVGRSGVPLSTQMPPRCLVSSLIAALWSRITAKESFKNEQF